MHVYFNLVGVSGIEDSDVEKEEDDSTVGSLKKKMRKSS